MAVNFALAKAKDIASGRPRRTHEEVAHIVATHCETCQHLRPSDRRCSLCGCPVADKIPLGREHCPLGKW